MLGDLRRHGEPGVQRDGGQVGVRVEQLAVVELGLCLPAQAWRGNGLGDGTRGWLPAAGVLSPATRTSTSPSRRSTGMRCACALKPTIKSVSSRKTEATRLIVIKTEIIRFKLFIFFPFREWTRWSPI